MTRLETSASHNGKYEITDEIFEAYILAKHGDWNIFTIRATPRWIMNRVLLVWRLDNIIEEHNRRKTK